MTAVELFAGGGGLAIALAQAGFRTQAVVEWDSWSCRTLNFNHKALNYEGQEIISPTDIRSISFKHLEGKIDLVSGGPPCQPFSLGGKHKAYEDDRDMFPHAIRALREIRPRAFVFENVRGLTRATFSLYLEYIQHQLCYPSLERREGEDWLSHAQRLQRHHTANEEGGLEYRLLAKVVNAADFGVPQKRERLIIVGIRADLGLEWNFPNPTHSLESLARDMYLTGKYWERHGIPVNSELRQTPAISAAIKNLERNGEQLVHTTQPWLTTRDAISDIYQLPSLPGDPNHILRPGAKSYPGHTGSLLDFPSKTLKAGVHGVPGGENMFVKDSGEVRYFTAREAARIQTFPDEYRIYGSWSESMRQIGNAVPVRLAGVVVNKLYATLQRARA